MATPVVKQNVKTVLTSSSVCPRCPHLLSAHVEEKARHCNSCACVAQDVIKDPRAAV